MGQVQIRAIGSPGDVATVMAAIARAVPLSGQSPQEPSRKREDQVLVYARTRAGEEGNGGER